MASVLISCISWVGIGNFWLPLSATANYACIWCKCPSIERHNSEVKWSMTAVELGARTIEENVNLASKRSKKYNVSHPPIFPQIPLNRVVVGN